MHIKYIILIILLFLVSCTGSIRPENDNSPPKSSPLNTTSLSSETNESTINQQHSPIKVPDLDNNKSVQDEIESLAAEFTALRSIQGQFSGGGWQEEVDAWDGRKHTIMQRLGELLGNSNYTSDALFNLLGPPDTIAHKGDEYFQLVDTPASKINIPVEAEILIYDWRGKHDFLYFVAYKKHIIGSDWWLAGE